MSNLNTTMIANLKIVTVLLMMTACAGMMLYEKRIPHTHIFDHKLHTQEVGLVCEYCHYAVPADGIEQYGMLPKMGDCLTCHQEKFDTGECAYCHRTEEPGPLNVPAHNHMQYSHEQHRAIDDWDMECIDCHAGAHENQLASQDQLPPMQLCLTCHQDWFDGLDCLNCHKDFTQIPLEPLSEFSHTGNFTQTHGPIAKTQTQMCLMCHDQPYCSECHQTEDLSFPPSLLRPDETKVHQIHEGDFLTRHFLEARFNSGKCLSCHGQQFCRDCHVREGIADVNPGLRTDLTANPHPLGFGFREDPTNPNFHGRIARREIYTCAGCHDNGADTICLECHATLEKGGWGINPHPRGFQSGLTMGSDRVCLYCHVP